MRLLVFCLFVLGSSCFGQEFPIKGKSGGIFSLGMRSTVSTFNGNADENNALGIGGQFRIQLTDRLNTEWFADYLPATNAYTRREDYHIGWSVLYYVREKVAPSFQPYVLAGHCFDYTHHVELQNRSNEIERWSSAIQAGIGAHVNLSTRLDVSMNAQYMFHLGTHIHSEIFENEIHFEKVQGGAMEGHFLFTLSVNYKIFDLWGGK